jgi:hypothetical protein
MPCADEHSDAQVAPRGAESQECNKLLPNGHFPAFHVLLRCYRIGSKRRCMQSMKWNRTVPAVLALVLAAGAWYRAAPPHGEAVQAGAPAIESLGPATPSAPAGAGWLFGEQPSGLADSAPAESLAQQLQRLSATRDPRDAYQAYRLLRNCMDAPRQASGPAGPCAGMTERMRMDRIVLLEQAARAGVDGAMVALVEEGPFGDPTALATRPDDPLVLEWKGRIGRMLGEQAGQGDWTSLYLLFTSFTFGNPAIAIDRQSALAYGLALRDIVVQQDGLTEDQAIPFNGPFLDQVKAGLSAEQQARAALQAAAIVDTALRQRTAIR